MVVTSVKFGECLGEVADQMREQDALHASRPSFPDLFSWYSEYEQKSPCTADVESTSNVCRSKMKYQDAVNASNIIEAD